MSTIKSSDEHLTLNADGSSKDIKFQANGVEKASISSSGAFTSTTIDATKLTGTIPNFTSTGIDDNADATAITIDSSENVGIGETSPSSILHLKKSSDDIVGATLILENPATGNGDFGSTIEYRGGTGGSGTTDTVLGKITTYKKDNTNGSIMRFQNQQANFGGLDTILTLDDNGRGISQFTARGWVQFDGSGTLSVKDSHNVSSVTDSSNGHYEINWTVGFLNDDYSATATSGHLESADETDSYSITSIRGSGIYAGKVEIQCLRARFDVQQTGDPKIVCLVAFGD